MTTVDHHDYGLAQASSNTVKNERKIVNATVKHNMISVLKLRGSFIREINDTHFISLALNRTRAA